MMDNLAEAVDSGKYDADNFDKAYGFLVDMQSVSDEVYVFYIGKSDKSSVSSIDMTSNHLYSLTAGMLPQKITTLPTVTGTQRRLKLKRRLFPIRISMSRQKSL